jgi:molybdopterin synthase sulfur carrier subunit
MATVIIPALLRKFTDGIDRIDVPGKTIREVVRNLGQRFPAIVEHLIEHDELKPSVAVSIDGEMATAGVLEQVGDNSEIHFIPAIGGGA